MKQIRRIVAAVLLILPLAGVADTIYSTGFEQPDFVPGTIHGQGGWGGSGEIQGATVHSGDQAVEVGPSDGFSSTWFILGYEVGAEPVSVMADVLLSGTSALTGISLWGNNGFLAQIAFDGLGVRLGSHNASTDLQSFDLGQWHSIQIDLDFLAQSISGFVNGVALGSLSMDASNLSTFIVAPEIYSFGGDQSIFVDNFSVATVSSVPEPGTLALFGIGLLGMGLARRRKKA